MNKALLDTDILSEVGKAIDPVVARNATAYRQAHRFLTLSVISVMEVIQGYQRGGVRLSWNGERDVAGPQVDGCVALDVALVADDRELAAAARCGADGGLDCQDAARLNLHVAGARADARPGAVTDRQGVPVAVMHIAIDRRQQGLNIIVGLGQVEGPRAAQLQCRP